jgi:hypothetical protein
MTSRKVDTLSLTIDRVTFSGHGIRRLASATQRIKGFGF